MPCFVVAPRWTVLGKSPLKGLVSNKTVACESQNFDTKEGVKIPHFHKITELKFCISFPCQGVNCVEVLLES